MQIQRIKTLNEIEGNGSNIITKDYFDSNPVFYYCYRIFPFERGHGIFVANSIRRFLLYEIPTIAITSVLIRTVKENPETDNSAQYDRSPFKTEPQLEGTFGQARSGPALSNHTTKLSGVAERSQSQPPDADLTSEPELAEGALHDLTPSGLPSSPGPVQLAASELSEVATFSKPTLSRTSAAQMKKKKVTKKALKEQAAELFSYTSDPFAQTVETSHLHEVDILSPNLEANNQQSDQEVSSLTEFTTIPFVRESFLEILLNLKACVFENTFAFEESSTERSSEVLKGKLVLNATEEALNDPTEVSQELFFQTDFQAEQRRTPEGSHRAEGRRVREYKIWAKDLILPPGLKVKNPDLVLATLVAPKTNCELELSFEKIFQPDLTTLSMKTGRPPHRAEHQRRNVPIDGTLFPIKKVNFALSYTKFQKEVVTFEIWTNGALNPRTAIFQCVEKILHLFQDLRENQVKEIDSFEETALDEFEE